MGSIVAAAIASGPANIRDQEEQPADPRLREAESRRREAELIIESSPTGIVMIDESGEIVMVNSATERMFRADRADLLGQPVECLLPERYRGPHPAQRAAYFRDPAARSMGAGRDLFARRSDGEEFPVEVGLQPLHTAEGLRVLSVIVDISERAAMEEQIRQNTVQLEAANQALLSSNNELETFAFVASHDLQEPLRKIASYCQLLKEEYCEVLDDDAQGYLDVAINGAERLRRQVRDLLHFSRIATHGKPLGPTDAGSCIDAALENLSLQIKENQAVVRVGPIPPLLADRSQLTQLFQNLIGNSLKYRSGAPPVIDISCRVDGEACQISLQDNGVGIPLEYSEKVFQIFQRLHNRRDQKGTGIGLALCKRIVERFQGTIWVEPGPESGSVFHIRLLLADTANLPD